MYRIYYIYKIWYKSVKFKLIIFNLNVLKLEWNLAYVWALAS